MKRLLLASLFSTLLILSQAMGGDCGCGGGGPAPASYATCDACNPCGSCQPCCDPIRGVLMLPLKTIEWVTHLGCYDNGCGERYWGECSEPVDCWDPCDRSGNWNGCRSCGGGASVAGYAKSAPRTPTYAQRSTQPTPRYNSVNAEFGLDPSAQVVSRTDRVVVPAPVSTTATRPMTAQNAPYRAPVRR